jgi:hypothetical protein
MSFSNEWGVPRNLRRMERVMSMDMLAPCRCCKQAPTATWRCEMKMLVTRMALATSVALATLIAAEAAYAQEADGQARHHDLGTAIDSQATGEVDGDGPRVRVQPDDVVVGGRVIGADPDPFIRGQLRRDYDSGDPD